MGDNVSTYVAGVRTAATSENTSEIAVARPRVGPGGLLVASLVSRDSTTHSTPDGWQAVGSSTRSQTRLSIFSRTVESGEPSEYLLSWSAATRAAAAIISFSGVAEQAVLDFAMSDSFGIPSSPPVSIEAGGIVLRVVAVQGVLSLSAPLDTDLQWFVESQNISYVGLAGATESINSDGVAVDKVWPRDTSTNYIAASLSVSPGPLGVLSRSKKRRILSHFYQQSCT